MDERRSLVDHLEELRKRIIYSLIAVILTASAVYTFSEKILFIISEPVRPLVFTAPHEVFVAYLKIALFSGLFISSPLVCYQFWKFISSGLKDNEKKYLVWFWAFSTVFFISGAVFGYFIFTKVAIQFFLGFASDFIEPMITVNNYVSFLGVFVLVFGLIFELPLIMLFLTKLGLVTPYLLASRRKYAVILIFVVAALLTPPDVVTQVFMAIPLLVLYEAGILLSRLVYKPPCADYTK